MHEEYVQKKLSQRYVGVMYPAFLHVVFHKVLCSQFLLRSGLYVDFE
jgi:hypothetical protein